MTCTVYTVQVAVYVAYKSWLFHMGVSCMVGQILIPQPCPMLHSTAKRPLNTLTSTC